jgi:hypothetical protein
MTTNDVIKKNINIGVKPNVTFILPYLGEYSKVIDVIENINRIFINLEKTFVIIDAVPAVGLGNLKLSTSLFFKLSFFLIFSEESEQIIDNLFANYKM